MSRAYLKFVQTDYQDKNLNFTSDTASIYRFKMPIRGYGFCKVLPVVTANNDLLHLVHIYNYYGRYEINKDTLSKVLENDYLMSPIPMKLLPLNRGYGAWRILGKIALNDEYIPDYKFTKEPLAECNSKISEWYPLHDLHKKGKKACSYDAVKHLEHYHLYTPQEIEVRAAMEILKKEGSKIKLFFDLSYPDILDNYYRTINMPLYTEIPDTIRGKALI